MHEWRTYTLHTSWVAMHEYNTQMATGKQLWCTIQHELMGVQVMMHEYSTHIGVAMFECGA